MSDAILSTTEGCVLILTINRPERRNALDTPMYERLAHELNRAGDAGDVRVVVLTGAGGYFTAGNALEEFASPTPPSELAGVRFLRALAACPKPVLAAVEGGAIGIGTTLLLHCDAVHVGESTRFGAPFVNLGVCPEGASSLLLPRSAGYKRAAQILLFGEPFSAWQAVDAGIVSAVVHDGDALDATLAAARKVAALPPGAVRTTKALLRRADRAAVAEAMDVEERAFIELLGSDAARRAILSFVEPRARRAADAS